MSQVTITDEELMEKVRNDDLDQMVYLFDRYQKALYNFFIHLGSGRDDSSDLVQNLFVRVMKYRKSYKKGHRFKTWLYQMARNLYYDHYRKEMKNKDAFMKVENMGESNDLGNDESYSEIEEREEKLRQALQQLPEDKREVLVLSKFQGMKYEEIAAVTNTSVSNVKVKAHRAIHNLREIYFKMA